MIYEQEARIPITRDRLLARGYVLVSQSPHQWRHAEHPEWEFGDALLTYNGIMPIRWGSYGPTDRPLLEFMHELEAMERKNKA